MSLNYRDVKDWKPAGISIVDSPAHPLAVFEVYNDDESYIKKYIEVQNMPEENNNKVEVSEGFLERFLNGFITKSEETPTEPTSQPPKKEENEDVKEVLKQINEKINKMDERITKLEETDDESKKEEEPPTSEPIEKNETEGSNEETSKNTEEEIITKSIDPDLVKSEPPKESFLARLGRDENGMKKR